MFLHENYIKTVNILYTKERVNVMSTKEMAYSCIDCMSEQQMLEFIRDQLGLDDIPNQETLEAFAELKHIEEHPDEYKRYVSFEAAIADIMSEDDDD